VVEVRDSDNPLAIKERVDAVVMKGLKDTQQVIQGIEHYDGTRVRLVYQFGYNGDCSDARQRLTDAEMVEVVAIDPTDEDDSENAGVELLVVIRTDHTTYLAKLKEVTGLEPAGVNHNGDTDDVMYDFYDNDAFETANAVLRKVEAANFKFVESTGITN